MGTDIAELLIKNVAEFPATKANVVVIEEATKEKQTEKVDGGDASLSDINSEESNEETNHLATLSTGTKASNLTEDQITEKFRNHLLYGNVTEALDWATEHNLWGHALFLASKLDRRSHQNVMMKFANKLALNDPLQSLYQLMSLRMPSFVTSVVDKKWGDWRPHLAMILSNTSQKPDLDRKAIATLGDSLFHNGDVYGSHFCYLMAQVGFGKYEPVGSAGVTDVQGPPQTKLILLGSSHLKSFKEFATTEAIMMTEIYEYAVTLNDESFMIAEFQPYKFTVAMRLLDFGHQLKSFLYMEQLAKNIKRDPQRFDGQLVNNVYVFADRLRYYDPGHDKSIDANDESQDGEGETQKWIQELSEIVGNSVAQSQVYSEQPQHQVMNDQRGSSIDRQFTEINQQFNQLNLQYEGYDQQPPQSDYYGQPPQVQPNVSEEQIQYMQPNYVHRDSVTDSVGHQGEVPLANANETNQYDSYGYQPQPQEDYQQPQSTTGNYYNPTAYGTEKQSQDVMGGAYDYYGQPQQLQQPSSEVSMNENDSF